MPRNLISMLAVACAALLMVVTAGCGGGDDNSTTTSAESQVETTEVEDTTTDETETTETEVEDSDMDETTTSDSGEDTDLSGVASPEDCQQLADLSTKLSNALGGADASDTEEYAQFLEAFAERAPEEIRDDFQVLAENYGKLAEALEGYDPSSTSPPSPEQLAKLQQAASEIDSAGLSTASTNIAEWVSTNCVPG